MGQGLLFWHIKTVLINKSLKSLAFDTKNDLRINEVFHHERSMVLEHKKEAFREIFCYGGCLLIELAKLEPDLFAGGVVPEREL